MPELYRLEGSSGAPLLQPQKSGVSSVAENVRRALLFIAPSSSEPQYSQVAQDLWAQRENKTVVRNSVVKGTYLGTF